MKKIMNKIKNLLKEEWKAIIILLQIIFLTVGLSAQNLNIKGKVIDSEGNTLPGATVFIQGTTIGTSTGDDGDYTLSNVPKGSTLEFKLIGFVTQEIKVTGDKTTIIAIMVEGTESLDEVTVVAFSTQKKESVLASITTVKPTELKVPSSNLTTAFAGRVAGLISFQQSGEPGQDNASFFIRGITSFGADAKKDPLILIDGIELSSDDLARLNTDDIASFSIMKDATATSLYGARGANGVILVTTKEGSAGKVKINIRVENSFSSPTRKIEIADPVTFMRMHNEAVKTRDPHGPILYSTEKIGMTERGKYPDIYPATDWYSTMFNDVISNQRANISLSGGGTVSRYYVAASVTQDNGNMKVDSRNNFNTNISLTKYAIRSNVNVDITRTTELIIKLSASFDEYIGPIGGGASMYRKVMQANPVYFKPYYEADTQFANVKHILFGNMGDANYINPYAESLKGYQDYSKNMVLTQFAIKQDLDMLLSGLAARVMVNMDRFSEFTVDRNYVPFFYNIASYDLEKDTYTLRRLNPDTGQEYIGYNPGKRNINTSFYLETTLEYNTKINSKHNINGLLVYIMRQQKQGIADNLQLSLPNRNIGLSGRLAYNFDSRYFAEFNFGYNGSERFSETHRWGFFPSIGAAWMVSNEKFFEPIKNVISQFKLKGTYGLVGNDAIGSNKDRFYYLANVDMEANKPINWGTYRQYSPRGVDITRYANDKIGWEIAYKTNIGTEIVLVNGLSANIDFFREKRTNILLSRIIPQTMGIIPEVKANLGTASGEGFDVELNYEKFVNKDLWITGRGTFTYASSKVIEWEEPDYSETPWLSKVGYQINQTWGYIAERLFVDESEVANSPTQFGEVMGGDIKYRDVNGDGKISALDQVPIGYPTVPEINYGFGISVGYKGFDASVFFQGSAHQSFWLQLTDNGRIQPFLDSSFKDPENDGMIGQNAILKPIVDSYWSENNRNQYAFWPRLSNYVVDNNAQVSTWFMQDAAFIRLKSAELGYTFPQKIIQKIYINNLRIYVSGTNLLNWSAFKLWDPEMAGKGLGYPLQRVFNIGVNIGF
jgi:TonB-linked SusC/RagA family outer membrane protein